MLSRGVDIPVIVQKAKPAVVEILAYDQQNKLLKTGTGFFISPDGVLLTNYHVISGGSSYLAKTPTGAVYFFKGVIAIFEPMDIAKLQFFTTEVPYLTLERSFDAIEGQRVLVIGNPEGLEGTVSDGIISAFRDKRTLIQITAPVSPGSSGSPVLDESGAVIGMATQMYKDGQNLNFAIASEAIAIALTAVEQAHAESRPSPSPTPLAVVTPTPSVVGNSVEDYFNRGSEEAKKGNYKGAIGDFTEAIRLQPGSALASWSRGNAYYVLEQYSKAISDYTEAIQLKPDDALLHKSRAIAYYDLKQFDEAISDYTEAIRLQPNDTQLYEGRAIAYDNLKLFNEAISDLIEAIRLQPDLAATYEIRAIIYDKLGKSSEAAQDRKKAKELKGN